MTSNRQQIPIDSQIETGTDDEGGPEDLGSGFLNRRTLLSFALALVVLVFVFRGLNPDVKEAIRQIHDADIRYFFAALFVYYFSFVLRGFRWRAMLENAGISEATGHRMPNLGGMFEIFILSWLANSVLPARMGDAYRCFLIKQRAGASLGISLGTMLAERLIDLVVLVTLLLVSGLVVFGTHAPDRAEQAFLIGGGVVLLGVSGVVILWLLREHLERLMPARIMSHYSKVEGGLFDSLARPALPAGISVLIWICDGLRVLLVTLALGQSISFQAAIMVALLSALVSTVPITPAGLGIVEGIMIFALTAIGLASSSAGAIALLDRAVTYGSLLIVGGIMYLWKMKHDIRGKGVSLGNNPAQSRH